MADPIRNFFSSTLVGGYSDSDTELTLATGSGANLPDPSTDGAFNLVIYNESEIFVTTTFDGGSTDTRQDLASTNPEIVRVTARSGDVLTVARAQEGTTASAKESDNTYRVILASTKKVFDDINDAIANVDLTTLTGVEELTFDSTGDEEFGLPAGTTAQRPSNPSAGYSRYNTETAKLEIYSGGVWGLVSLENVRVMQTAQLSVTAADFLPPLEVEYLVIAGGGGGGGGLAAGGGGGAGGYRSSVSGESSGGGASAESSLELDVSTNYTVTVGAGGNGGSDDSGSSGSNSVFNTITSTGGGGGGQGEGALSGAGSSGGSGGGSADRNNSFNTGGSGTANQGFDGGSNFNSGLPSDYRGGAGGGGSSSTGLTGTKPSGGFTGVGGNGGNGVSSSITGSAISRAGGGGGGGQGEVGGTGGAGGGGNGATDNSNGSNGSTNTGAGGGGGGGAQGAGRDNGGSGGSGVVILRYPSDYTITIGAGLTGSETTVGANKVATITAGTGNVSWS